MCARHDLCRLVVSPRGGHANGHGAGEGQASQTRTPAFCFPSPLKRDARPVRTGRGRYLRPVRTGEGGGGQERRRTACASPRASREITCRSAQPRTCRSGPFPFRGAPPPRTKWTRRVPHPVLIGHAASLRQPTSSEAPPALLPWPLRGVRSSAILRFAPGSSVLQRAGATTCCCEPVLTGHAASRTPY